jgi:hypothetical protein
MWTDIEASSVLLAEHFELEDFYEDVLCKGVVSTLEWRCTDRRMITTLQGPHTHLSSDVASLHAFE